MNIKGVIGSFPFLAISYPDGYYHLGDGNYHPEKPIETRDLGKSMRLHPKDWKFATSLLKEIKQKHPNVEAIQKGSVHAYEILVLKKDHDLDQIEFDGEIIERFWVATTSSYDGVNFLQEDNRTSYIPLDSIRLTFEEAEALSKITTQRRNQQWTPCEVVYLKLNNTGKQPSGKVNLHTQEGYVIQFSDGMYAVEGEGQLETRSLQSATKFSLSELEYELKNIKETSGEDEIRKNPFVYKLSHIPRIMKEKSDFDPQQSPIEIGRFYTVGRFGRFESKDYLEKQRGPRSSNSVAPYSIGHYFKPEKIASEKVLVDMNEFYYLTEGHLDYYLEGKTYSPPTHMDFKTEYDQKVTFTSEEAFVVADKLNQLLKESSPHLVVEIVVVKEKVEI